MNESWDLSASNPAITVPAARPRPAPPPQSPPPPAAASQETDAEFLVRLKGAIDRGLVRLDLDYKVLAYGDSPVFTQSEDNRWFFAILAGVIAAFWFEGWRIGLAVLAAGAALYLLVGKARMRRGIESRVRGKGLEDVALWRKIWTFGGVSLTRTDTQATSQAPQDNWFAFVRELPK